ncbi:hypothetical protein U1Q18_048514 [Sarracenia purpurea var. burkii]
MSLTPNLRFDRSQLKIIGLTDLGEYTPLHQQNCEGDHALVVMFQPFIGSWVQAVGAFLSKGAAPAKVLNEIMLEAIVLLENSGFNVDAIVTDGANWNRGFFGEEIPATLKALKPIFDDDIEGTCEFIDRIRSVIKAMNSRYYKGALYMNNTEYKHFFGLVRASGGTNDHPDAVIFIYIFRLLCVYSLVRPPKGSNIGNENVIKNLLQCDDGTLEKPKSNEIKDHLQFVLDRIIDNGDTFENLDHGIESNQAMQYFAGFVARKCQKFTSCVDCQNSVLSTEENRCTYLKERDHYGALKTPSLPLWTLLQRCRWEHFSSLETPYATGRHFLWECENL